ncbi:hypothetical protein HDV00_004597 [Rhizophlyctis rosea]|nr:hypothetical protein HDV00_004597 [Rhizophlyctis rosea]
MSDEEMSATSATDVAQSPVNNAFVNFGEPLSVPLVVRGASGAEVLVEPEPLPSGGNSESDGLKADEKHGSDVHVEDLEANILTGVPILRALSRSRSKVAVHPSGIDPETDDFDLELFLKTQLQKAGDKGFKVAEVILTYKDLSVYGAPLVTPFIETVGIKIFKSLNPIPLFANLLRTVTGTKKPVQHRQIIMPMSGFVKPGEMTLVLGRPGAGCSTLLRVLANLNDGLSKVDGDVLYNGIDRDTFKRDYSAYIAYSPEDDPHYPGLTGTISEAIEQRIKVLVRVLGLRNCVDTKVGDENIRGCSGGEKKRVSIAEQLCSGYTLGFWDGSTKGLDSSSALDFVRALRTTTNVFNTANVVSLYQASKDIYDLFDRIILMANGRCIYFGPAKEAKPYFESLGFYCPTRKVTPDFLTAITEPTERELQKDFTGWVPTTPEEFENVYRKSSVFQRICEEQQDLLDRISRKEHAEEFQQSK